MHDFRSLKLLDWFAFIFKRFGIDYATMRKILAMKLTMDQRRAPTIFNNAKKKEGNQFLKSLGIYALYGLILIPFVFLGENYIFMMSILFGIAMFILMTSMVSDFSSVLLDVRDKTILNTKPVSPRTVSAAKIVHVGIYMTLLTGAFIGVPALVMLARHGIAFFLIFLVMLVLLVFFIIALTALVYIFILRYFSSEKLKDVINYVQILLSIGIFVGYQVLIRSFDVVDFDFVYTFSWWHVLIPPIWFGAPFELLLHQDLSLAIITLSLLALVIPILSIFIYYRLMPAFERNLQKLMEHSGKVKKKSFRLGNVLSRLVCFRREERAAFRFAYQMMKQEREFKLKVYPSIGLAFILPFIFIYNQWSTTSFAELAAGNAYLTIYACSIMVSLAVHMLRYSANYNGSWIFRTAPIRQPGALYSAALKAFLLKLYMPIFVLLAAIFIAIFSLRILPDLAVVLAATCLLTLLSYKVLNNRVYPFSEPFQATQDANTMKNFLIMFLIGLFAFVHYMATLIPYGNYIYFVVLLLVILIGWRKIFFPKGSTADGK